MTPRSAALLARVLAGPRAGGGPGKGAPPPPAAALESLGLRGAAFGKSEARGRDVVLTGVTGDLDGRGPVRAEQVVLLGFSSDAGAWSADSVVADRVSGAMTARRLAVAAPKGGLAPASAAPSRSRVSADGFDGPLYGLPAKAETVTVTYGPGNGAGLVARRLALPAVGILPAGTWDMKASAGATSGGRVALRLESARSEAGAASGSALLLATPAALAELSAMPAQALSDPARWPDGVLLADLDATVTLRDRPAGLPAVLDAAAQPQRGWAVHIRIAPRAAVAVKDVPGLLASGSPGLGLSAEFPGAGAPAAVPAAARQAGGTAAR